jgi:hypothetical protein
VDHRYRADGGGALGPAATGRADWQRAWDEVDEVDDLHLEGEEVHADADMAAQWK